MKTAKHWLKICWGKHLQPATWAELLSFNLFLCSSFPPPVFDFSASANITHRELCARQHQASYCSSHHWNPHGATSLLHSTSLGMTYEGKCYSEKQVGCPQEKKKRLSLPITTLSPSIFAIDRVQWTYLFLFPTTTLPVALLSSSSLTKRQNPVLPHQWFYFFP